MSIKSTRFSSCRPVRESHWCCYVAIDIGIQRRWLVVRSSGCQRSVEGGAIQIQVSGTNNIARRAQRYLIQRGRGRVEITHSSVQSIDCTDSDLEP